MKNPQKIFTVRPKTQSEPETVASKKVINLQRSLKWVLFLAQCFGQMPVVGIAEPDARFLKFSWKSLRTIYCLFNCVGSGLISSFYVYRIVNGYADLFEYGYLVFHFNTFVVTLSFLKLATEWPRLMRKWSRMESSMRSYGWPPYQNTRITLLSIIVLTTAAIEYAMIKTDSLLKSNRCKDKDEGLFEYHCIKQLYTQIFSAIGYSLWKGIVFQIENVLVTFAWSFNDLFIMLMSTALALRFKQITTRLNRLKINSKADNKSIWREIREDYDRLSKLTKRLDEALSYVILTSFASNLFFILMQLFNSIRKMKNTLEKIYFFFSFGFLILRTICVSLYGAWIYDESREPLTILNSVSSDVYNIEIKRLVCQIKFDTVALTGKNFFYVTRGLVLSMAGAIVTYELVFIQFNENLLKQSAEAAKNSTSECQ